MGGGWWGGGRESILSTHNGRDGGRGERWVGG